MGWLILVILLAALGVWCIRKGLRGITDQYSDEALLTQYQNRQNLEEMAKARWANRAREELWERQAEQWERQDYGDVV